MRETVMMAMSVTRSLQITMNAETANTLERSGYFLYGLKGVETTVLDAKPLVWFRTPTYSLTTTLDWKEDYRAYARSRNETASVIVDAYAEYDIALGEMFDVLHPTGTGVVLSNDDPTAITIANRTTVPFSSGLGVRRMDAHTGASESAPFCEIPLPGGMMNVLRPLAVVLLFLSNERIAEAKEVLRTSGPGIRIDFQTATHRAVAYDIKNGWNWNDATWGKAVPVGSTVTPSLEVQPR